MLVLSRKQDQKVSFPSLGITVQILRVKGSTVRLGVDAPMEVRIIRDELEDAGPDEKPREHVIRLPQNLRHELRNELNALSISLHLFKQEMDAGYSKDAEATFQKLVTHLERVCTNQVLSREGVSAEKQPESTALLVEDEANEREMLAGFLRLHGYQVATAGDGLEAMEYLENHEKPSVVLIDMRMPRCDGPSTIRRIRENPAYDGVKIFAISGSTPEENHVNPAQDGLNGWFMKPLNPRSLVDAMAVTIGEMEPTAA
ncbi:MAG: response regulator [Planctomycetota bacterium]|nr:MAG: response regulator [Planctomycetota bacterium]